MGLFQKIHNRMKKPIIRHIYSHGDHLGDVARDYEQNQKKVEVLEEKRLNDLKDSITTLNDIRNDLEQLNQFLMNPREEDSKAYRMLEKKKLQDLIKAIHTAIVDFKIQGDVQQRVRTINAAVEQESKWQISKDEPITEQKDKLDFLNDRFVTPLMGVIRDMQQQIRK